MPDDIDKIIASLGDKDPAVRTNSEEALVKIGAPAVDALILAFDDVNRVVRRHGIEIVVRIGPPAVEALCMSQRLLNSNLISISLALGRIGDRVEMPRKVLLDSHMSVLARIACLNALNSTRAVYFETDDLCKYVKYNIPPLRRFLMVMSRSADPEIRKAADELLYYMESDDVLLRPSESKANDLLRAASGEEALMPRDELLLAAEEPPAPLPGKPGLLQRFRRSEIV